ncbi:DNA-directed RNA polymerase I subunit RPA12-like [Platysternon megacephalum]|uniref:DNA-directed RNA polymerase I subunit RPA12-like n=1 Tax=Platysternon megacephalum TaxID=55544 RepID=A0A4D9DTL9_9SAUR|nr:DNA-directed RNA polymerase I subunit RPA12-like [Platysternon megacephalum]
MISTVPGYVSNVTWGQINPYPQALDPNPAGVVGGRGAGGGGAGLTRSVLWQNCSSQPCVAVLCKVEMLERDQWAMVTVHSVLWMQSVRKWPHDQFIIQSQAWFNVSAMPFRIQPKVLPSGHATAHTEVVRTWLQDPVHHGPPLRRAVM